MLEAKEPSQPGDHKLAWKLGVSGEPHTGAVHPEHYKQHLSTPRSPHAIGHGISVSAFDSRFHALRMPCVTDEYGDDHFTPTFHREMYACNRCVRSVCKHGHTHQAEDKVKRKKGLSNKRKRLKKTTDYCHTQALRRIIWFNSQVLNRSRYGVGSGTVGFVAMFYTW